MSTDLRAVLDLVAPTVRRSAAALWRPAGLRARYARYLREMHGVLRASVPLMTLAATRCGTHGDPVRARLADYLPIHIAEELGHDDWLLADMAGIGLDPDAQGRRPPSVRVARLVGPQYYWINHAHPVAILGYIALLEGNSPAPGLAALLAGRTGFPACAFRTVAHHADADPVHSDAVFTLLAELDLDPDLRALVRASALHTAAALIDLFDDLSAPHQEDIP